jgi:hypothetical protein
MQSETKRFTVTIKGKDFNYHYYFSHEGTPYKSGLINLFIQADEPEKKNVRAIRITVPDSYADKTPDDIELLAKAEVLSFYSN